MTKYAHEQPQIRDAVAGFALVLALLALLVLAV